MMIYITTYKHENSEYVMVNKMIGMLQYYDADEISADNIGFVLGISVLAENSIGGVGQCSVIHKLQRDLYLAVSDPLIILRFQKENEDMNGEGNHAIIIPVAAMTLDDFVSRCSFVADRDREAEATGIDDYNAGQIQLTGVDTALGKLIKLLNAFGGKFSGSTLRLANAIRVTIMSNNQNNNTWDGVISNSIIASGINTLLHHLSSTIDPLQHVSSAILIESLQDSLNSKYGFQDEWEVVDILAQFPMGI